MRFDRRKERNRSEWRILDCFAIHTLYRLASSFLRIRGDLFHTRHYRKRCGVGGEDVNSISTLLAVIAHRLVTARDVIEWAVRAQEISKNEDRSPTKIICDQSIYRCISYRARRNWQRLTMRHRRRFAGGDVSEKIFDFVLNSHRRLNES